MRLQTKVQSAAAEALQDFITKARTANPFGDVPWSQVYWEVGKTARASSGKKTERIWFNSAFVEKSTLKNAIDFPAPFGDFVKAYACDVQRRTTKGVATAYHNTNVRAFRYLYHASKTAVSSPWQLLPTHFDAAMNSCLASEERGSAYRVGGALARIANAMDKRRLCAVRLDWKNPVSRDAADGGSIQARVGPAFAERRNRMLPREEVIAGLGAISNRADLSDADLARQRALELLTCGGFRACELLTLPRDCLIEEPQLDEYGQQMLGPTGVPVVRCGIRYIPAKRGHEDSQIKWLPSVMVDVAKRALDDISRLSQPFRDNARFAAENPGRVLLPKPWQSKPSDELLTLEEIYSAVGLSGRDKRGCTRLFVDNAGLTRVKVSIDGKRFDAVSKWELEQYLVARSGSETVFPEGQDHYLLHECLFVFGVNFFHTQRPVLNGTSALLTDTQLRDYMVGREAIPSIFERLEIRDVNGNALNVRSHQFRHWLDTMAEDGGMSQLEIARWFGRKDIGQNAAYNHVTGLRLAASIHEKRSQGRVKGPVTDAVLNIRDPKRRAEFVVSSTVTAHHTDIGVCEHNWAALPCPNHRKCTVCDDHLLEKGNPDHIKRTRQLKDSAEDLVAMAESEVTGGTAGANNWLEHQKLVVKRAITALAVHANDSIPDGTLVQLPSLRRYGDVNGERTENSTEEKA
ncbi:hypothetical protein [Burkholderia stagnalis]|uniref:hypothetical protein n=1 Tax=Burkholderia stagnalis TaxID=1503054 RepID=UPI000A572F90|nr:hypothetical protein [Burkholderia stagnalis]